MFLVESDLWEQATSALMEGVAMVDCRRGFDGPIVLGRSEPERYLVRYWLCRVLVEPRGVVLYPTSVKGRMPG